MTINSHQDHTASYYAATANKQTVYEQLNGHKKTDVCVIGAGFTGISAALHLAERGYKVHVLEANKDGWGASGRNGGQMIGGISGESRLSRYLSKINEKIVLKSDIIEIDEVIVSVNRWEESLNEVTNKSLIINSFHVLKLIFPNVNLSFLLFLNRFCHLFFLLLRCRFLPFLLV